MGSGLDNFPFEGYLEESARLKVNGKVEVVSSNRCCTSTFLEKEVRRTLLIPAEENLGLRLKKL